MRAINILTLGACLFLGLASCEMKDEIIGNKEEATETGLFSLGVDVNSNTTTITKADNVDTQQFPVTIYDAEGKPYKEYSSYAKLQEESPITLPIGKYTVEAHSAGDFLPQMSIPYFGGDEPITIQKDVETSATVTCKMQNMPVKITYETEFLNQFATWDITISDGTENNLLFDETDKNPATIYWHIADNVSQIRVHVTAYTAEGVKVDQENIYTKQNADEDYEEDSQYFVGGDFLNIKFEKGDPEAVPGAQIGISVDLTFSTTEDTVEIPVDNNPGEPEEPEEPTDPEAKAPSITIPQDVYTLPGDAEKNADAVISAEAGLKSVKVQIVANNSTFASIVSGMFGAEPFELIGNETLEPVFSGMGINLPSEGDTEYKFPVGNFFSLLSEMGATEGEGHVFNITVEDKNSKTATSKLNVKVEQ